MVSSKHFLPVSFAVTVSLAMQYMIVKELSSGAYREGEHYNIALLFTLSSSKKNTNFDK